MNYYVLLGVRQDADPDAIRSAFRALARRYHPDAGEGSSPERFREVLAAYETLNDPNRRGRYDRSLLSTRGPTPHVVEPLTSRAAREPMLSRRRVVYRSGGFEPLTAMRVSESELDGVFQLWQEVFLDLRRRGIL